MMTAFVDFFFRPGELAGPAEAVLPYLRGSFYCGIRWLGGAVGQGTLTAGEVDWQQPLSDGKCKGAGG